MSQSLSVVFSFWNEEKVISKLIERTRGVLKPLQASGILSGYELIFVNDASTDSSLEILLNHAEESNDVKVVNMSRKFGVSPCVMAGLTYAKGDMVVYMDADLQDPPEVIPQLIEVMRQKKADVVHTVRQSRKGETKIKLWITHLIYLLLNKISNVNLPVEAGDFKLLSRRAVNHLIRLKEHRPFMRGLVCWIGFKQEFVPYHRDSRQGGTTKFVLFGKNTLSNFFNSVLISFSATPLWVAYFFGIVAIIFDLIFIVHVGVEKFSGRAVPGWTAIMVAVLFLGGVQLLCLGIMGLYIYSIHEQGKYRPNYIVESTVGFSESVSPQPPLTPYRIGEER